MHVHPMLLQFALAFTKEEKRVMAPSFAYGDAEDQLSYAVHAFGSKRVADLVVAAGDKDIGVLALTEVQGFAEEDLVRIKSMVDSCGR